MALREHVNEPINAERLAAIQKHIGDSIKLAGADHDVSANDRMTTAQDLNDLDELIAVAGRAAACSRVLASKDVLAIRWLYESDPVAAALMDVGVAFQDSLRPPQRRRWWRR